jgi:DNA repair exonuclease SbcCD nuclease subunit
VFKSENFSCVSVPGLNLTVYGAADETGNSDRRIMKSLSIDRSNAYENIVVMVHGSVQLPWLKNDNYFPISREELNAAEAAYVALGHYHSYYPFDTRTKAAYSGSPVLLDFEENGKKHVLLARISGNAAEIEPLEITQKYDMKEMEVDSALIIAAEDMIEKCRGMAEKNRILRVTLTGIPALDADLDGIMDEVNWHYSESGELFHIAWKKKTSELKKFIQEDTLRGAFIKKMEERIKTLSGEEKSLHELALRLGVRALENGKI